MTNNERAVLQAAFDLARIQDDLDCNRPPRGLKKQAMSTLMDACAEIAAENDGKLVIQDDATTELCEALDTLLFYFAGRTVVRGKEQDMWVKARAALAKARQKGD